MTAETTKEEFRGGRHLDRLRAAAEVTRRTRSLGFIECDVKDEKSSIVAKVFSTCMVLRGKEAEGR